jgi:xanthine dehydrogenase accessory factor
MDWLESVQERVRKVGAVARVVIISTDGPTPRAAGTAMLVWRQGAAGRIGRGEAERRAIEIAREMLARQAETAAGPEPAWLRMLARFCTGNVLGESSGGTIEVLIEVFGQAECAALAQDAAGPEKAPEANPWIGRRLRSGEMPFRAASAAAGLSALWRAGIAHLASRPHAQLVRITVPCGEDVLIARLEPPRPPFYVYGTGLVARALVKLLAELPFEVIWIDTAPGHFPEEVPVGVVTVASGDVEATATSARDGAFHAVMTADHDLDLAVCRRILRSGNFHYLGVIGSLLKRERLLRQLAADGIEDAALERLACPIGLAQIKSKQPEVIAVGIAAQALAALPAEPSDTRVG